MFDVAKVVGTHNGLFPAFVRLVVGSDIIPSNTINNVTNGIQRFALGRRPLQLVRSTRGAFRFEGFLDRVGQCLAHGSCAFGLVFCNIYLGDLQGSG